MYQKIIEHALNEKIIDPIDNRLVFFYDFSKIKNKIKTYQKAFPSTAIHSIPLKTAPLKKLTEYVCELGAGLECASEMELGLALKSKPCRATVLNAPFKTPGVIKILKDHNEIDQPIFINVNDLQELDEYADVYKNHQVFIRINPLVTLATEEYLQTADYNSKFGQLITDEKAIIDAFKEYSFLVGLHVHTGSDFKEFEVVTEGIKKTFELAKQINNSLSNHQVKYLNIGGGLSADSSIELYCQYLKKAIPELWSPKSEYTLITEFGRHTYLKSAWCISKVELIKYNNNHKVLLSHLGAQSFLREIYTPKTLDFPVSIYSPEGRKKTDNPTDYALAGPLCFGGDFLSRSITLPEAKKEDWIVLQNVGANTLGLFSKHCSQPFPLVIGYSENSFGEIDMQIIKKGESSEEVINFW